MKHHRQRHGRTLRARTGGAVAGGGILYHLDVKVGDIVEQGQHWRSLTAPKRNPTSRKQCRGVRGAGNLGAAAGGSE